MPIYEYECDDCSKEFEILLLGGDTPACPDCESSNLRKLMSAPAAPGSGENSLPICSEPAPRPSGGCGLPQCGQGFCAGGEM